MRRWITVPIPIFLIACALAFALFWVFGERAVDEPSSQLKPVSYAGIPGWADDDHAKAFAAFARSCAREGKSGPLTDICRAAAAMGENVDAPAARNFFESRFTPHRYGGGETSGFVTGYFEPELKGARTRSEQFNVPVYAVPGDLVQLYSDETRAARNHQTTAVRETPQGRVAYFDRQEIEQGALDGRGLEILYLENWADAFYMHIQGSGRIELDEGGQVRLGFAAKNGHPYTAIGKALIERGAIAPEKMSMEAVRGWLDANPDEARKLMWLNKSYIFFSERDASESISGPIGAQGVALSPLRSLAVDTSIHAFGTPIWVEVRELDVQGSQGFAHLMVAQDAGSAIKGRERGDIYFGSGAGAGANAGAVRHGAKFTILLPKTVGQGS